MNHQTRSPSDPVRLTASALGLFFVPGAGAKVAAIIDLCIVPIFLVWKFDPPRDKS